MLYDYFIYLLYVLAKSLLLIVPVLIAFIVFMYAERRLIGFMQVRYGPNRLGHFGILQPIADAVKLLFKEFFVLKTADRLLYLIAPIVSVVTAFAAWVVIPFDMNLVFANVNAGVLYVFAMTSLGAYAVIMAGWASNSKYPLFAAMRSLAQTISYEIAMGFALVSVLLLAGSMNFQDIVLKQAGGVWNWYAWPLFPVFVVYWISAVAETNRAPFDMVEGESEIITGHMTEYGSMGFAMFFIAEYVNMTLISVLAALMFLGGWLSPFEGIPVLDAAFSWVPNVFWLIGKSLIFVTLYIWMRATLPRYRYDQIMTLGWKVLIPISLFWLLVVALIVQLGWYQ